MPKVMSWAEVPMCSSTLLKEYRGVFDSIAEGVFARPELLYGEDHTQHWNYTVRKLFHSWLKRNQKSLDDFVGRAKLVAYTPYNDDWIEGDWSSWGVIHYYRTKSVIGVFKEAEKTIEIRERPKTQFDLFSVL
jgi:hypothetical protein